MLFTLSIEMSERNQFNANLKPIVEIAKKVGLRKDEIEFRGNYIAKIPLPVCENKSKKQKKDGKLILVTAINPTKFGEGKTSTTIGIVQAIDALGKKAIACIRQPSMGPVFGIKGGGTGGGCVEVLPRESINLHFTGDIHAIESANNLLSAMIDNHLHFGNKLGIKTVDWQRAIDLNDRALREITVGLGKGNGPVRKDGFVIAAASEVMAIACLAKGYGDLKKSLGEITIGFDGKGRAVKAKQLKAHGAMSALLRNAMKPNLVQTTEHSAAFVHGGAFGNIAHGCSSIIATKLALKLSDYVVTEAGFGSELGMEKFMHIKCRKAGIRPDVVVIVTTVRALKAHSGVKDKNIGKGNLEAVQEGFANLEKHIENVRKFGLPCVVAINRFPDDKGKEIEAIKKMSALLGVKAIESDVYLMCSPGGMELAREIVKLANAKGKNSKKKFRFLYGRNEKLKRKIEIVAREMYGAKNVVYSRAAKKEIMKIEKAKLGKLPICFSKTQYSLSDNPALLGKPKNFSIHVNSLKAQTGSGFIIVYTGSLVAMPGLPKKPAAEAIILDLEGGIRGLA